MKTNWLVSPAKPKGPGCDERETRTTAQALPRWRRAEGPESEGPRSLWPPVRRPDTPPLSSGEENTHVPN